MEDADREDERAILQIAEVGGEAPSDAIDPAEAVLRMCHDLVTPAVTIGHLAELIASEEGAPAEVRRRAALIARESTVISEICAFTLSTVRDQRPMLLDQIVSECVTSARTWFGGTIEEKLDSVRVLAQRVPMLRLVTNLLNNACQAAGPDGSVRITLSQDRSLAYVEVVNTGAQLDPALLFGPHTSGTPATLGLRVVAEILTDYHGQIRIEPGLLGGTTVQVELPLDATGDAVDTARRRDG